MALARAKPRPLVGHPKPRIAPPVPARHDLKGYRATAEGMGISLMPWQEQAGRYLTAIGPDGHLLFRDVCIVVARQQGKTTMMKPYIVRALRAGKKVLHLAQNRNLPRIMFATIADALEGEPDLFPTRRGKIIWPRRGGGTEEILLVNGGSYRIAAAGTGGARGLSADIVIIDELREMTDQEVIEAADPTLIMSPDPQMIYLSNAGHENSVVLNSVRERADRDASLAYLEWSASPERPADDREGWVEANPAIGHYPYVLAELERAYTKHSLGGTLATFETENLCRWVTTMRERLVDDYAWVRCKADTLEDPRRPVMAVAMAPDGSRASAALAWQRDDGDVAMRLLFNVTNVAESLHQFGTDLADAARALGVTRVAYDPLTDHELVKYLPARRPLAKAEPIGGALFATATATFVAAVVGGRLHHHDADAVTDDLTWTARKTFNDERGRFEAVRASDDHPITAALATIRAVYLASGPQKRPGGLRVK